MKQKLKLKLILNAVIILVVSIIVCNYTNYVSADTGFNFEKAEKAKTNATVIEIIKACNEHDTDWMQSHYNYFTSPCYDRLIEYVKNNDINADILTNFVIDFTYPENSTTGDTVIMANTKAWLNGNKANVIYLFEFHVNSDGIIYGYNVWAY